MAQSKRKPLLKRTKRLDTSKTTSALSRLKALGLFGIEEAKQAGVSQPTLSRWVSAGKIRRLGPGLYQHPEFNIPAEDLDYIIALSKFGPESVIGGLTALFYHGLIEQVPGRVWVMVPYSVKTSDPLYRCIRTKNDPKLGIEEHKFFRITNLERTLVEAFRYSTKIGLRVALQATRTALKEKRTTLQKILKQAKALRLEMSIERHWESIIPESQT